MKAFDNYGLLYLSVVLYTPILFSCCGQVAYINFPKKAVNERLFY